MNGNDRGFMSGNTKDNILNAALDLFSKRGYEGASMSDIADLLGITKAALYKHYKSKQEILDGIIKKMETNDFDCAEKYDMPQGEPNEFSKEYKDVPLNNAGQYALAMFKYWTENEFASQFRKMLTIEQFRSEKMTKLYQNYLCSGPLEYMVAIFKNSEIKNSASDEEAMQLALDFYGTMFLLYGVYDGLRDKQAAYKMLEKHIDKFFKR